MLPAMLEAVIGHQAKRTPNKVGGPVDIIRVRADGVEWLKRNRLHLPNNLPTKS